MLKLPIALTLSAISSASVAQGLCLRPTSDLVTHCIVQSTDIRALGACSSIIEQFNKQVDEWQQCQLDQIDKVHREKRTAALDQASEMKSRLAELLAVRARHR